MRYIKLDESTSNCWIRLTMLESLQGWDHLTELPYNFKHMAKFTSSNDRWIKNFLHHSLKTPSIEFFTGKSKENKCSDKKHRNGDRIFDSVFTSLLFWRKNTCNYLIKGIPISWS